MLDVTEILNQLNLKCEGDMELKSWKGGRLLLLFVKGTSCNQTVKNLVLGCWQKIDNTLKELKSTSEGIKTYPTSSINEQ